MSFVQIITYTTSEREALDQALKQWLDDTEDVRRARTRVLLQDRDNPDRYVEIVSFDSYEDAMHNSTLPATGALSKVFAALTGELRFQNLNLVVDTL
jgi:hypothetical protein